MVTCLRFSPKDFQHEVPKDDDLEGKTKLVLMISVSCFPPKHVTEALTLQTENTLQTITDTLASKHLIIYISVSQYQLGTAPWWVSAHMQTAWVRLRGGMAPGCSGWWATARDLCGDRLLCWGDWVPLSKRWFYCKVSEMKGDKVLLVKMTKINTNI